MLIAIAVILSLAFIAWIIWLAVKRKSVEAHSAMYGLSILTAVYTLAFFLSMDIPQIIKVLSSITLGALLIFLAAYFQRRRQPGKP